MAFKEVQDLRCEVTIALGGSNKTTGKANPTQIEGYYLGFYEIPDRKKKSGFCKIYAFKTQNGQVGVWGKTDLDRKMEGVTPGAMLRVTQKGTVPTPNGDMYKFKVEVDEENTIEVAGNAPSARTSGSRDNELSTSYDDSEEAGLDDEETPLDEVKTPAKGRNFGTTAGTTDAKREARLQELLAKSKRA